MALALVLIVSTFLLVPSGYGTWTASLGIHFEASTAPPPPPTPTHITATIDVDPDTLNTHAGGVWITAYVEFPDNLPVGCTLASIDITTVRIRVLGETITVPAVSHPSEIGDEDGDGIPDRSFKFSRADVVNMIGGPHRWVTLEVFGDADGCSFTGTDTIHYGTPVTGPPPGP